MADFQEKFGEFLTAVNNMVLAIKDSEIVKLIADIIGKVGAALTAEGEDEAATLVDIFNV